MFLVHRIALLYVLFIYAFLFLYRFVHDLVTMTQGNGAVKCQGNLGEFFSPWEWTPCDQELPAKWKLREIELQLWKEDRLIVAA